MGSKIRSLSALFVGLLLVSCASPRGVDEPPMRLPALKAGYGRVYFTRPGELQGWLFSPRFG